MATEAKSIERMNNQQLKRRIELNQQARFGLQNATVSQLNIIFMLCRRLDLDPLEDITLMHGHPWYTINGTLKMMRRHREYAGFQQWPLKEDEKVAGGWQKSDIVWATTIRTRSWGEITQWGKVTQDEVREGQSQKTPIGSNPVEMAQKRSAQHCIRAAFGHEAAPDEAEMEQLLAEEIASRNDPVKVAQHAAKYDQIFGEDEPRPQPALPVVPRGVSVAEDVAARAAQLEADVTADSDIEEGDEWPGTALSRAWQRNKQLSEEAHKQKIRPRTLSGRASLEEIEAANSELETLLNN